ncbi:hypothetical protein D0Z07_1851 [Hyphodiscus hymeniophilus]|uniref:Uncharacterized protein n=1 Tax=Hyphodiscus hymeniophilus TaxID=353542 RepID=A0A9P6VP04_9HELO|nr:hypothetical protein D0Z07_1851 [Hyphodiscus hymeniophilus]
MMGRQRTFDLVPTSLMVSNGPKPPMTSKQAKKAHQLATRGPTISKAEQRRQAAEELARQKKEYERERASAKAKAVREKKAAREQAEREERKRLGVPEPSKFVRASQPTISRFVNKGNKRTWRVDTVDEVEESDTSTVRDDKHDVNPEHPAKKAKTEADSEDEYGGFPSFTQSELGVVPEENDSPVPSKSEQEERLTLDTTLRNLDQLGTKVGSAPRRRQAEVLRAEKNNDEPGWESMEDIDDMAATQLLSEAAAAVTSPQQPEPTIVQVVPCPIPPRSVTASKPCPSILRVRSPYANSKNGTTSKQFPTIRSSVSGSEHPNLNASVVLSERPALQGLAVNIPMPPPPVPVPSKVKRAISFAPSPPIHRSPLRIPSRSLPQPDLPPSATQAFLEDHLDDFFPSPSQEIRELLEDIDDLPTNTQIARELEPDLPTRKPPEVDSFDDLICTQDFILSSQDILEITTPCPPALKPKRSIESPRSTPTPIAKPAPRQPKGRFFQEKDEDLLHAAIHESKALLREQEQRDSKRRAAARVQESKMIAPNREDRGPAIDIAGRSKRTFQRTVSNATDYGEDEFHDCEAELLALC